MDKSNSFRVVSTAVVVGCAGIAYFFWKHKYRSQDAVDAFKYMDIDVVTTEDACRVSIAKLQCLCSGYRAVGFDCEWVSHQGSRQPVALIQLSSIDGYCALYRMSHLKTMPLCLKDFLECDEIYKVGVAPGDDAKYLFHDYGVKLSSTLDIRHIAEKCLYQHTGLGAMAKSVLGVVLNKSWRIRCSNWEAHELTEKQISYAAADAHVAIKILVTLMERSNRGLISWFSCKKVSCDPAQSLDNMCRQYININFKLKPTSKKKNDAIRLDNSGVVAFFYSLVSPSVKTPRKEVAVTTKRYPHATRSRPLYHNCTLQAPDGELLCTCDNKKALWYVEKELGDVVGEEPLTVRLRFEPAGRSAGAAGRYYQLNKENKCVVCGRADTYIRKNIVPREYRKFYPEIMKDHSSHDVVLLCGACHQASNARDQLVRERLAEQCAAPLARHERARYSEDADRKKIRSAARALLVQARRHQLPAARRAQLEELLLEHHPQHELVTQELLEEAAAIDVVVENPSYESHGRLVVEQFQRREGGLLALEELWRAHFLSAMRPRHMPALWSLRHTRDRLRTKLEEGRLTVDDLEGIGPSKCQLHSQILND